MSKIEKPKKPTKALKPLDTPDPNAVSEDLDNYLRSDAIVQAINASLPAQSNLTPIPANYKFKKPDRETVSVALHAAFELCGGVPALVQWAKANPDQFIPIWAKLLNSQQETAVGQTTINIMSPVPHSPLDNITIDESGAVINLAEKGSDDDIPE